MANYEKGNKSCMYTKIREQTGKGIREPTGKGGVSTVMANYEKGNRSCMYIIYTHISFLHLYSSIVLIVHSTSKKIGKTSKKGDMGMANYEKQVEQEATNPIPISLYNCYRTVMYEKRCIASYPFLSVSHASLS